MGITREFLNSKLVERFRRNLVLKTGIYCRIKRMSPTVSDDLRTAKLLNHYRITKVIDIGANTGQFAESLIDFGYKGEIISFEPVQSAYNILLKRANKYKQWQVAERCAIGNIDGKININVSQDTVFSSIKTVKKEFADKQSNAVTIAQEEVNIYKLDFLMNKYFNENENIFLKIDTQGYEKEVIEGAQKTMQIIKGIKLEIPLVNDMEIYEDIEWDLLYYMNYLTSLGFKCVSIESIGADKETGFVNEVDGMFFKM